MSKIDYKSAGVDIDAGSETVDRIKDNVKSTFTPHVLTSLGSFGSLYDLKSVLKEYENPVMVQSIDGVGTKTIIARKMKKYDLVSILRPTTEDNTVEEIHKNITEIITSNGGKVEEQGVWKKRKLAYQIDTFDEGIYTITTFEGPANLPNELDRVLKISDDVIRHKVLKMES